MKSFHMKKPSILLQIDGISKVWEGGKSDGAEAVCGEEEDDRREEGGVKIFSLLKDDESRELSLGI
jgi:hypothetical protein